ncbi:hypothetical protein VX159_15600 [Dechloromonas sp. ZY10]|uniref:hypothetical protein n=1 Tax=Dechloromonas aquae TaxID=2664436 RepID=UPI00352853CE
MSTPDLRRCSRLLAVLLLSLGASLPAQAGNFFCCPDPQSGRRVCGDSLPEQCRGRAYRILDGNGNLVREVPAALTPEQKAAKAEEERRRQQQEEIEREQKRKDTALLATYASQQDIDMAQQKAENDAKLNMQGLQARLDETSKKRKKAQEETEFYRGKPQPPELTQRLKSLDSEIAAMQQELTQKQRDFSGIKQRYDSERQRFRELTGR